MSSLRHVACSCSARRRSPRQLHTVAGLLPAAVDRSAMLLGNRSIGLERTNERPPLRTNNKPLLAPELASLQGGTGKRRAYSLSSAYSGLTKARLLRNRFRSSCYRSGGGGGVMKRSTILGNGYYSID